ncbi:putative ribonuclease H-like domain-containing protein [Tanacetum coccineum]
MSLSFLAKLRRPCGSPSAPVYVDDIIFGSTNKELCTGFEKLMKDKFQMSSMGELTFFLGLQVQQKEDGIFISQDKYVAEILKKFNYSDVKSASTPVDLEKPLVKDGDADDVDVHLYRSMIGSLMYLTASRPDIMFAVCACARFQVTPKTSHLLAVKRIFRYLKGKPTLGLWYSRDSPFELVAYTDSDYAGATQDRKSTTGGCQFLGNRLISWQCKKQTVVATSITEAEYVATVNCCGQVLWIQNQLLDYGYNFMNTVINIDNNNLLTKGFDAGRFQYLVSKNYNSQEKVNVVEMTWEPKLQLLSKFLSLENQKHLGMSKEVGTPTYLSLVAPLKKVGDKDVHKELGDRMERAATTASSLEAEQDSVELVQVVVPGAKIPVYRANYVEITLNSPIESNLSQRYTLGSGEDSQKEEKCQDLQVFERLKKLMSGEVESSEDQESLGSPEDASKHGRSIEDINADVDGLSEFKIFRQENHNLQVQKLKERQRKKEEGREETTKGSRKKMLGRKRAGKEQQKESSKKQKVEKKKRRGTLMKVHYLLKEQNGSSKRYSSMIRMLQGIDKEDLEALWRIVKAKYGDTRPDNEFERVLWGRLKVMVEPTTRMMYGEFYKDTGIERLERKKKSRPTGLKRLKKVGMSRRVESSEDQESLGDPEDASKQGRSIADLDKDDDATLVDKTQERQDDELMFDTRVLDADEMPVEAKVDEKDEQSTKLDDSTAGEAVTTASVEDSAAPTTIEEITFGSDTYLDLLQEPSKFRVSQEVQPSISPKDKGKGIMIETGVLLKRKDQIALDEQIARDIQAKLDAELIEEQKLARKQEEEANIALIEAQEKRNRPPTKAQKRTQTSTYLKHMGGYTYKQLKGKSFDEIQKLFNKEMKRVNTFVAMGSEVQESKEKNVEGSEETAKGSRKKMLGRKRAGKEQQQESLKKQRMKEDKDSDEVDEASEDDECELMKHLVIKKDDDITIDAISLTTKLPMIIDYKLHKKGMLVHYQLIGADKSSKRYSLMIRMLQGIDREDLEALWKIVKTKYSDKRPEDEFERVLWGDLKVMFEPDIRSDVWRILQGYRVTIWKLIDSSGVHFVRFDNLHIFMLVEKRYPLTPVTITNMLNKKLQTDHQNEMCYQLLKLMKMNIKFRGGLLGLKRLHGFLEVTTAQVHNGNYAKCVAGEKITTADYNCLKTFYC